MAIPKRVHWAEENQTYSPKPIPRTPSPAFSDDSLPESSAPYTPPSAFDSYVPLPPQTPITVNPLLSYDPRTRVPLINFNVSQPPSSSSLAAGPSSKLSSPTRLRANELRQPATYPPLNKMEIQIPGLPWKPIQLASNQPTGVTVGEVMEILYCYLRVGVQRNEYSRFPLVNQQAISAAFRRRCDAVDGPGVNGPETKKGLKRIDCLGGRNRFMGLSLVGKNAYTFRLDLSS